MLGTGEEAEMSQPAHPCRKNLHSNKSFAWVGDAKE